MRPRNSLQRKVAGLFPGLRPLTEAQREWADLHCFGNAGYLLKGNIWCERCGHVFPAEGLPLVSGARCPHCGRELTVTLSRKRKSERESTFTLMTTCKGMQVLRCFELVLYAVRGMQARVSCRELFQNWINPDGRDVIVGLKTAYCYRFADGSFEIRESAHPEMYSFEGVCVWPHVRVIPELKLRGWLLDWPGRTVPQYRFIKSLLTNPRVETLVKAGQLPLADNAAAVGMPDDIWAAARICMRNGYTVSDAGLWRDMVAMLARMGKDIRNACYVCPDNLKEAHDRCVARLNAHMAKEEEKKLRKELDRQDAAYAKRMKGRLEWDIKDADLTVAPLRSVTEFYHEGRAMHHCVYGAGYWHKANCLVLTARVSGERAETVEVDTRNWKIRQSRGAYNKDSDWHDRIVGLVERNMNYIRGKFTVKTH